MTLAVCRSVTVTHGRGDAQVTALSQVDFEVEQGTVFGLFHMLGSLARCVGPMIATGVYTLHHSYPFWVAGAMTAAVGVWSVILRGETMARMSNERVPMTNP